MVVNLYYIIYQTTNNIDGMTYRGCHQTKNLNDEYLGSGKYLKRAIKKYGKENFSKNIICLCYNLEHMIEMEKFYIDEDWSNSANNYNLQTGGLNYGVLSEESRKKISNSVKSRHKEGVYKNTNRVYKSLSMETKEKISKKLKEKYKTHKHPTTGIASWNKGKTGVMPTPWNKGLKGAQKHSEESKEKISVAGKKFWATHEHHWKGKTPWNAGTKGAIKAWNKGKKMPKYPCKYCGKMVDKMNLKKWHDENCKLKEI